MHILASVCVNVDTTDATRRGVEAHIYKFIDVQFFHTFTLCISAINQPYSSQRVPGPGVAASE